MAGSVYGTLFKITTWGESHGPGVGVVIDGCPAGLPINETILQSYLDKRKPGLTKYSTPRVESDMAEILSGTFEGLTTGAPISILIRNQTQRSKDYSHIAACYRPGHADYTFDQKYGFRDYRGGGRTSGRETIGRVAAGAVAGEILTNLNITVTAYVTSIGPITIDRKNAAFCNIEKSPLHMPDLTASEQAEEYLSVQMQKGDSAGGIIECIISGMPPGIGEPVFEKLDASLAKAILSIGAVKGVEIGDGFLASQSTGSLNNDQFSLDSKNCIQKNSNHAGGILGGLSDGSDIIVRAAFKPTPSISKTQQTVTQSGESIELNICGRHDPIIVPRAVVVVESMCSLTLVDLLLQSMSSKMDNLTAFFRQTCTPHF